MNERTANLWSVPANAVVITTNGLVKKNGQAVMGRGCAKEAALRWPDLPRELGALLREQGNHVFDLKKVGLTCETDELAESWVATLVSFPVKHKWFDLADRKLIERSAIELESKANRLGWETVVMPRPGCGNGGLEWEGAGGVREIVIPHLDDRFTVVELP